MYGHTSGPRFPVSLRSFLLFGLQEGIATSSLMKWKIHLGESRSWHIRLHAETEFMIHLCGSAMCSFGPRFVFAKLHDFQDSCNCH